MTRLQVRRGFRSLIGLLALLCSGALTAGAAESPAESLADAAPIEAVWKPQRLAFRYQGNDSFYSCDGLAKKIQGILLSIGAREDIRLSYFACHAGLSLARFQIEFHSPIEATPQNVEALTTYSAEEELVAHARGETLTSAADLPRFPAQWQEVSFARDRRMRLQPADCELVKAVRRQILARMAVRILRDQLLCSPSGNTGRPRLTVSALMAVRGD